MTLDANYIIRRMDTGSMHIWTVIETSRLGRFSKSLGGTVPQQHTRSRNPKIDSKDVVPIAYSSEADEIVPCVSILDYVDGVARKSFCVGSVVE